MRQKQQQTGRSTPMVRRTVGSRSDQTRSVSDGVVDLTGISNKEQAGPISDGTVDPVAGHVERRQHYKHTPRGRTQRRRRGDVDRLMPLQTSSLRYSAQNRE